ncbi:MAG TPA: hypothetical protein VIG24_06010 [Acidimicrobiia bacterium]
MTTFADTFVTFERIRRDGYGRYLVLPPGSVKPVGYTRATTVAKALDDTSALMAWGERMTAIGLAQRPDLLAQVDAVKGDKRALNGLCQKAKEQGGATVRRDLGTALHGMLEQSFNDADYTPPASHIADVNAVHAQLAAAGLEVVDGMTERVVVWDEHRIAGTFDLLLRTSDGELLIADIKTGSSVNFGALGFCVQLSIYAHADAIYVQGDAADGSEDERIPMPAVSRERAVIIHVEPGSGVCTLHHLRLDPAVMNLALEVRKARGLRDLLEPWKVEVVPDQRDAWIRRRIDAAVEVNRELVRVMWPSGITTPKKQSTPYSSIEIDELDVVLGKIEAELGLAFGDVDPRVKRATPTVSTGTTTPATENSPVMPHEGELVESRRDALKAQFDQLSASQRDWISARVAEARRAGLPIRVAETPTERRCYIAEALFHAVTNDLDETRLRSLIAAALHDDIAEMPSMDLGAVLGLLNAEQAFTLAVHVSQTQPKENQ